MCLDQQKSAPTRQICVGFKNKKDSLMKLE